MRTTEDAGMGFHWPDGTWAGAWDRFLSHKTLRASTDTITVDGKTLHCVDFTELPRLKLRLCADPDDDDNFAQGFED
jgi:hypothetical protein